MSKSRKRKKYNRNSSCNNSNSNKSSNNSNLSSKLCRFSSLDFIILASTLAVALGEELSNDDIEILASFFAILSDELALISSFNECGGNDDDDTSVFIPPIPDVAATSSINKKNMKKKK